MEQLLEILKSNFPYVDFDKETGLTYPIFSVAGVGNGGFLAYRSKTDTKEYRDIYEDLIALYLDEIGAKFTEKEIEEMAAKAYCNFCTLEGELLALEVSRNLQGKYGVEKPVV